MIQFDFPFSLSMTPSVGTGKTLVARALASHASKAGKKVSFFMRKGADILSKWVGEAERQLRLLFEEAQKAQPAIIFFDEIDGLAPVSSLSDIGSLIIAGGVITQYAVSGAESHLASHYCPLEVFSKLNFKLTLGESPSISQYISGGG